MRYGKYPIRTLQFRNSYSQIQRSCSIRPTLEQTIHGQQIFVARPLRVPAEAVAPVVVRVVGFIWATDRISKRIFSLRTGDSVVVHNRRSFHERSGASHTDSFRPTRVESNSSFRHGVWHCIDGIPYFWEPHFSQPLRVALTLFVARKILVPVPGPDFLFRTRVQHLSFAEAKDSTGGEGVRPGRMRLYRALASATLPIR
jgi:hypothetical protein